MLESIRDLAESSSPEERRNCYKLLLPNTLPFWPVRAASVIACSIVSNVMRDKGEYPIG
jgi:hypothetical protein